MAAFRGEGLSRAESGLFFSSSQNQLHWEQAGSFVSYLWIYLSARRHGHPYYTNLGTTLLLQYSSLPQHFIAVPNHTLRQF